MNFGSTLHVFCVFLRPGNPDSLTKFSRIPVSTSKNFPDSGIRTPLHGVTIMLFRKTIITKYTVYPLYFFLSFFFFFLFLISGNFCFSFLFGYGNVSSWSWNKGKIKNYLTKNNYNIFMENSVEIMCIDICLVHSSNIKRKRRKKEE